MSSNLPIYQRPQGRTLASRLRDDRRFIQVVAGPRQVGKTTLARQVGADLDRAVHSASADEPTLQSAIWIAQQWEAARLLARKGPAVLVLDEIQKATGWAEAVKRLWDEDTAADTNIQVVLLGSAPLLIERGLTESLAGRFEVVRLPHWSFGEMRQAFGWSVEQFICYGGYPGAAPLIDDPERWVRYLRDSLIETTIARDVLLLTRVDKPALLRRMFELGCRYAGQILSYNKMLGQLQDAGNTTTLAHYLDLLAASGMISGLQKYAGQEVRRRGSSPKLQPFNTGLVTAQAGFDLDRSRADPDRWGRLAESAVGAHLLNAQAVGDCHLYYWRHRNHEVDFVVEVADQVIALEVKTGADRGRHTGTDAFLKAFPGARPLLVGPGGVPVEQFLSTPIPDLR